MGLRRPYKKAREEPLSYYVPMAKQSKSVASLGGGGCGGCGLHPGDIRGELSHAPLMPPERPHCFCRRHTGPAENPQFYPPAPLLQWPLHLMQVRVTAALGAAAVLEGGIPTLLRPPPACLSMTHAFSRPSLPACVLHLWSPQPHWKRRPSDATGSNIANPNT